MLSGLVTPEEMEILRRYRHQKVIQQLSSQISLEDQYRAYCEVSTLDEEDYESLEENKYRLDGLQLALKKLNG